MPYDNNTPLANQRISATQQPIRDNFAFLQTSLQRDHQFNTAFTTEGVHKQCSMANQSTPSVPPGCNGVYYVKAGEAWYNNGVRDVQISLSATMPGFTPFQGTLTLAARPGGVGTFSRANITPTTSGDIAGFITVVRDNNADGTYDLTNFYQRITAPTFQYLIRVELNGNNTPYTFWNSGTLEIRNFSSSAHVFYYQGWFYPTV